MNWKAVLVTIAFVLFLILTGLCPIVWFVSFTLLSLAFIAWFIYAIYDMAIMWFKE